MALARLKLVICFVRASVISTTIALPLFSPYSSLFGVICWLGTSFLILEYPSCLHIYLSILLCLISVFK